MRPTPQNFKVVLLGEGRVGKTSIALRYVQGVFSEQQQATVQAAFLSKRLSVEGQPVQLSIWDTAGQERFHALGPIYYRDADAALLVYDVTDADSFARVQRWVRELQRMAPAGIALSIAANKVDLDRSGQRALEEARRYAESIGATLHATSAKQNVGVDDVFTELAQRLVENRKNVVPMTTPSVGPRKNNLVIVDDVPRPSQEKSQCCF